MDDITSLQIRILSDQVTTATSRLHALERQAGRVETATGGVTRSFAGGMKTMLAATGVFIAAGIAYKGFTEIISHTRNYQVLQASLKTATGSVENAGIAFKELRKLAVETPFSLNQVTESFIKLTNYGLKPSREAIIAYGNISAGMGKDLSQMIEAVADASVGEFTRIKETFGIKGKNLGDTFAFTFRGITTEVKANQAAVEEYFTKLGNEKFSGAMADRMKTLDGAFSNFGDSYDILLTTIGSKGLGDAVENGVRQATSSLDELTTYISSGEFAVAMAAMEQQVKGQSTQWSALGKTLRSTFADAATVLGEFIAGAREDSEEFDTYWENVFNNFPTHLNYALQMAQINLERWVLKAKAAADDFSGSFEDAAKDAGWALSDFMARDLKGADREAYEKRKAETDTRSPRGGQVPGTVVPALPGEDFGSFIPDPDAGVLPSLENRLRDIDAEADAREDALMRETDAAKAATDAYREKAAWIKDNGIGGKDFMGPPNLNGDGPMPDDATDPLAGFYLGGGDAGASTGTGKKKGGKSAKSQKTADTEFEMEMLKSIYEKEAQNELEALQKQENEIRNSYEKRKIEILRLTDLTDKERLALTMKNEAEYAQAQQDFQVKNQEARLKLTSDFFGNISAIAGAFGKKGAKIAKAAAITQTVIETYASATKSYSALASIPYVGPALGAAAAGAAIANGLANVARIKAQDESGGSAGAYAQGGIVPGQNYRGDKMKADVNSDEMILTRGQQHRLFEMANGRNGGGGAPKINVYNLPGQDVDITRDDTGALNFTVKRVMDLLVNEANSGGGRFVPAMARNYGMKRTGR
jgi:hypothetical protein